MPELLNGKALETAPTQNVARNAYHDFVNFTELRSLLRSRPSLIATSPESLQTSIPVVPEASPGVACRPLLTRRGFNGGSVIVVLFGLFRIVTACKAAPSCP